MGKRFKRLLRWTFKSLATLSAVLSVAVAVLWVRGRYEFDQLVVAVPHARGPSGRPNLLLLESGDGRMTLVVDAVPAEFHWEYRHGGVAAARAVGPPPRRSSSDPAAPSRWSRGRTGSPRWSRPSPWRRGCSTAAAAAADAASVVEPRASARPAPATSPATRMGCARRAGRRLNRRTG